MNECLWYFTNLYDLNKILKAQRSLTLINDDAQKTLASDNVIENENVETTKDSNFYVVVSGGANISSNLYFFKIFKNTNFFIDKNLKNKNYLNIFVFVK